MKSEVGEMTEMTENNVRDNPYAMLMIEKYAEWQNRGIFNGHWEVDADEGMRWHIEDFFTWGFSEESRRKSKEIDGVDLPSERQPHGETFIISDTTHGDRRVIWVSAGIADDGGPAQLIGYFDGPELELLLVEFDTAWQIIYGQEYESGRIGYIFHYSVKVDEVEAQGLKLGSQEYSEEEKALMENRPVVKEA